MRSGYVLAIKWRFLIHLRDCFSAVKVVFIFIFNSLIGLSKHFLQRLPPLFGIFLLLSPVETTPLTFLRGNLASGMCLGLQHFEGSLLDNFLLRIILLKAIIKHIILLIKGSNKIQILKLIIVLLGRTQIFNFPIHPYIPRIILPPIVRQYLLNEKDHSLLVLKDGECVELPNSFREMDMRVLLEMVHDHIDIEHIIASFPLISNFQFICQNLIIPIVIHLIHQLHQLQP